MIDIIARWFIRLSMLFFILTSIIAAKKNKKGLSLTIWFILMEIAAFIGMPL